MCTLHTALHCAYFTLHPRLSRAKLCSSMFNSLQRCSAECRQYTGREYIEEGRLTACGHPPVGGVRRRTQHWRYFTLGVKSTVLLEVSTLGGLYSSLYSNGDCAVLDSTGLFCNVPSCSLLYLSGSLCRVVRSQERLHGDSAHRPLRQPDPHRTAGNCTTLYPH